MTILAFPLEGRADLCAGSHHFAEEAVVTEAADGLGVEFHPGDWPQLRLEGVWDWSQAGAFAVDVTNPGPFAVPLLLRLDSGDETHSETGRLTLPPARTVSVVMPLDAVAPAALGMKAGPVPDGVAAGPSLRLVTQRNGAIDPQRVTAVRLVVPDPTAPLSLSFANCRVLPGEPAGKRSFTAISDRWGQFAAGQWPEKIHSDRELLASSASEKSQFDQTIPLALDKFGGLAAVGGFATTGYFHAEKKNGRWWLVSPAGHGFFSLGMNGTAIAESATPVKGREFMFAAPPPAPDADGTVNFYVANLRRKYGAGYLDRWRTTTAARLRAWGFNTLGNWSDITIQLPYVVALGPLGATARAGSTGWWSLTPDPFDPAFPVAVERMAADAVQRFGNDPRLLGYFVENELSWGEESPKPRRHYGLPLQIMTLGRDSPAKSAFLRLLRERHGDVNAFNRTWGVALTDWRQGLDQPVVPSRLDPAVIDDLRAFLELYTETYYSTVALALKRADPHHLYLGSRIAERVPEAIAACDRHCDVVSFNVYRDTVPAIPNLHKPILISEFHFGSIDRGPFWAGVVDAGDEEARAVAYDGFLTSALANPAIVGCQWFEYVDEPVTGRVYDGENGHIGFVAITDIPYADFTAAVRHSNLQALRRLSR